MDSANYKYAVLAAMLITGYLVYDGTLTLPGSSTTPPVNNQPIYQPTVTTTLPPQVQEIVSGCTTNLEKQIDLNIVDRLNETGWSRLSATAYMIVDGVFKTSYTTSTSDSTAMKVPCDATSYKLAIQDNDQTGVDVYYEIVDITDKVKASTGRISLEVQGSQMGTLNVTAWDNLGTRDDTSVAIGMGEENKDIRFEVKQTEDDKEARNIICMFNYSIDDGLVLDVLDGETSLEAYPVPDSQAGTFKKAFDMKLTLDSDSRTANPDRKTYTLRVATNPGFDPTNPITIMCVDSEYVLDTDNVAVLGGIPIPEVLNTNVGIASDYTNIATLVLT